VVPTTSQPPRRSKSKAGSAERGNPIKGIRLKVTLSGAGGADFGRLAAEKGLAVDERRGGVAVELVAASPEEALAQLRLLAELLARKA
jgi:hypothetical protein